MSDTELMAKSERARRVEVFTGAGRRRSWSAEEKARIVATSLDGGESVSAVARRHGLTPQQLLGWRRQAYGGPVSSGGMSFASVAVSPAAIEIEVGGALIRVSAGVDGATLQAVLHAVKAVS